MARDLYFSGWALLITHGMGLNAAFLHLDRIAVAQGDEVARGQVIGTVGVHRAFDRPTSGLET